MNKNVLNDLASFARDVGALLFYAFLGMSFFAPPPPVSTETRIGQLHHRISGQQADLRFTTRALNLCLGSVPFSVGNDIWMPHTLYAHVQIIQGKWREE